MVLAAAAGDDERAFLLLVERERRALRTHCHRMLGSADDAEDAVQETLLRAWRGRRGFRGQSSPRTWLHRIATNVCIDTIQRRRTRPETLQHGAADEPIERTSWTPDAATAPEARYEQRETVELAFRAAREHLPTRQRAALILRDVLDFSAKEAASRLDTTVASVNSALRRARERARPAGPLSSSYLPGDAVEKRFANAIERGDIDTVVKLVMQGPQEQKQG